MLFILFSDRNDIIWKIYLTESGDINTEMRNKGAIKMKILYLTLILFTATLASLTNCDTSTNSTLSNPGTEKPANQFVGIWEAVHEYTSGYTDPVVFPVALDTVTYTLVIKNDGSFIEGRKGLYVDSSVVTASYSGIYVFEESILTLTYVSGTFKNETIDTKSLPDPGIFELTGSILVEKNSNSYECPTKDSDGNLMYPIIRTFTKK